VCPRLRNKLMREFIGDDNRAGWTPLGWRRVWCCQVEISAV